MIEVMDIKEDTKEVEDVINFNILTTMIFPTNNMTFHILGHS